MKLFEPCRELSRSQGCSRAPLSAPAIAALVGSPRSTSGFYILPKNGVVEERSSDKHPCRRLPVSLPPSANPA